MAASELVASSSSEQSGLAWLQLLPFVKNASCVLATERFQTSKFCDNNNLR